MLFRLLYFIYRQYGYLNKKRNIFFYKIRGKKPWSSGYHQYKEELLSKILINKELLNKFKKNSNLPKNYGLHIDERIIEYPWLIANLPKSKKKLLDAGSVLNNKEVLNNIKLINKKIYLVTLCPEKKSFWQRGISYIYTDLRELPFKNNNFDIVTCISTLEHIGMDNTLIYVKDKKYKEEKKEDYLKALLEIKRVLKPGGLLLLTLPFGKYQYLKFMQQFDEKMVSNLIKNFKPSKKTITFYKYLKSGWNLSNLIECRKQTYFNIHELKDYDKDFAAAARAVVCLKLLK